MAVAPQVSVVAATSSGYGSCTGRLAVAVNIGRSSRCVDSNRSTARAGYKILSLVIVNSRASATAANYTQEVFRETADVVLSSKCRKFAG